MAKTRAPVAKAKTLDAKAKAKASGCKTEAEAWTSRARASVTLLGVNLRNGLVRNPETI